MGDITDRTLPLPMHPPLTGRVRRQSKRLSLQLELNPKCEASVPVLKAPKQELTKEKQPQKPVKKKKEKGASAEKGDGWDRNVQPIRSFAMIFTNQKQPEKEVKVEMERIKNEAQVIIAERRNHIEKELSIMRKFMGKLPEDASGSSISKKNSLVFKPRSKTEQENRERIILDLEITEPRRPPMNYYEPVEKNFRVADKLQLSHVPYISELTDDMAVCSLMYKFFPNGIHGYLENATIIDDYLLFQIMKATLPDATNPDLFYYALHRLYPNKGSQKQMSSVFSSLCDRFAAKDNLAHLESWKWSKSIESDNVVPVSKFNGIGNYLTYHLPVPSPNHGASCSENCWKQFPMSQVELRLDIDNWDLFVEIFVLKNADKRISDSTGFLNALFFSNGADFCEIAAKFDRRTCLSWYQELLKIVEFPTQEQLECKNPVKEWKTRDLSFRTLMINSEKAMQREWNQSKGDKDPDETQPVLETVIPIRPCCHFGACGRGVPGCSCEMFCTALCGCDINCPRRYPGCRCKPGACRTNVCPCVKFCWECQPGICSTCSCDEENEVSCGNFDITLNRQKHVVVGPSNISGWGAFITEDVKKDEYIGEYVGEHISEEETERRGQLYNFKTSYIFDLKNGAGSIDATRAGNVFRFVNHAKNATCSIRTVMTAGKHRLAFFARKDLQKGQELTFDYKYSDAHAAKMFNQAPEDRVPKMKQLMCSKDNSLLSDNPPNTYSKPLKNVKKELVSDSDKEEEEWTVKTASRKVDSKRTKTSSSSRASSSGISSLGTSSSRASSSGAPSSRASSSSGVSSFGASFSGISTATVTSHGDSSSKKTSSGANPPDSSTNDATSSGTSSSKTHAGATSSDASSSRRTSSSKVTTHGTSSSGSQSSATTSQGASSSRAKLSKASNSATSSSKTRSSKTTSHGSSSSKTSMNAPPGSASSKPSKSGATSSRAVSSGAPSSTLSSSSTSPKPPAPKRAKPTKALREVKREIISSDEEMEQDTVPEDTKEGVKNIRMYSGFKNPNIQVVAPKKSVSRRSTSPGIRTRLASQQPCNSTPSRSSPNHSSSNDAIDSCSPNTATAPRKIPTKRTSVISENPPKIKEEPVEEVEEDEVESGDSWFLKGDVPLGRSSSLPKSSRLPTSTSTSPSSVPRI